MYICINLNYVHVLLMFMFICTEINLIKSRDVIILSILVSSFCVVMQCTPLLKLNPIIQTSLTVDRFGKLIMFDLGLVCQSKYSLS